MITYDTNYINIYLIKYKPYNFTTVMCKYIITKHTTYII